jgi:ABC-2 type transport system permease protein
LSSTTIYDSSKRKHPAIEELLELFKYRDLLFQLVRRNIVARYKRSILGVAWTMLNPLGTMLVMVVVFSQIFNRADNYAAYILTGITCWTTFTQSTTMAMNSMVWGSQLITQIYVPRTIFVVSTVLSSMVNFFLSLIPLGFILLITKVPLHFSALLLPIFIIYLFSFSLGIALLLSTLAPYFPDLAELYPVFLRAWMYLSPIIIPLATYRTILNGLLLYINPFYYIINLFRILLIDGFIPHLQTWIAVSVVSFVPLILGWIIFSIKADSIAYNV